VYNTKAIVAYDDHFNNLTVTEILFWNAGRETIRSKDIAGAAPLFVIFFSRDGVVKACAAAEKYIRKGNLKCVNKQNWCRITDTLHFIHHRKMFN
jgi:hypothetical protein